MIKRLVAVALFLAAHSAPVLAATWTDRTIEPHGARISYPDSVFSEVETSNHRLSSFASDDGVAQFVVGSWFNDSEDAPPEFKRMLTGDDKRFDDATYAPKGRNWFVLSGYRGDDIYYQKIMFSCDRRLVNIYAILYPVADRERYDPIVERMENGFRPGSNC